ncbi:hypothetical protein GALMADRAFT_744127 [Galerina marginata CBS 339.88]|uniref:DUF3074 domain-containing protein n=1 Tax=Galerina marginata (strain CBS 339.88) TaxID=685588 RepID=A0A067SPZ1_GALM3|nr:hypothetical protein GALMADRAFT_744127 [Galerina marginata CBS 339.88]
MDQPPQFKIPASFSLTPNRPSQIPSDDILIKNAQTLLEATLTWQAGKTYQGVKTFVHLEYDQVAKTSYTWHCIVSEHHKDEVSFHRLWSKLGRNKAWNRRSYGTGVAKVTRVKYISEWQGIWTMLYNHPPPMSRRVYTVYQASWLLEYSHRRRGIMITLPINLLSQSSSDLAELEDKGVKGRYVGVEHLQEMEGNLVEWRRVSCMDPGGLIPKFWIQKNAKKRLVEVDDLAS